MIDRINQKYNIILASKSPRRQQLLKQLGIEFKIKTICTDETFPNNLKNHEIAEHIAREKADAFRPFGNQLIVTADTVVCHNNNILGKPGARHECLDMLRQLSNNTHEVITGVCLRTCQETIVFHSTTRVTFDHLSEEEIAYYTDRFKPYDKAGAYGIQEWIGMIAVKHIEGSYFNVMGLPVHTLYQKLKSIIHFKTT